MSVLVFGSLNLDVVFRCETMPRPGETMLCPGHATGPGGKGLNQAVAARRAGSIVHLAGAIGQDASGLELERFLASEGIATEGVQRLATAATGIAHIVVDRSGENAILVASGANGAIEQWSGHAATARVWLAQLELAPQAVAEFLRAGRDAGAICVLNAAPAIGAAQSLFPLCDVIVVNEHELADWSGRPCDPTDPAAMARAAARIADLAHQVLIVTAGARGVHVFGVAGTCFVPAVRVVARDTTGAGNCFCGVLADGLASGLGVIDAVRRAAAAAALAVQHVGAAVAMPNAGAIADLCAG